MSEPAGAGEEAAQGNNDKSIKHWLDEVEIYEREAGTWLTRSRKIVKRYKDERDDAASESRRFNILWSNVETMRPSLFSRTPKPDIQRRFKDADPVGRVASDVLERSTSYFVDSDQFGHLGRQVVMDYLLPGRGTAWVRYVPHMKPADGQITDDISPGDQDTPQPEVIAYEEVIADYLHMDDFGHNICRTWEEVWLGWRKVYLDRAELVERFKEAGKSVPLDFKQKNSSDEKVEGGSNKATIYEAWDKKRQCAVWFHKEVKEYLDYRPDPLRLEHFFPFPRPLLVNIANDSLIPTPDYVQYQDQATELDNITARIAALTKALKVAGCYDASAPALGRILSEGKDNELVPVEGWAAFAAKGGLEGAMSLVPIKDVAAALIALYEARDKVKADLYEITGIADIIRGQSDPNETMGAQRIKSNFATMRLSDRQAAVQTFMRELVRIMVNVIGNHFQIETIAKISGVRLFTKQQKALYQAASQPPQPGAPAQQPPPPPPYTTPDQVAQMMDDPTWEEVGGLIKDQVVRSFRIDIETDSTIKADEEADKASRIEFLEAIGKYLSGAIPAAEKTPELLPVLAQGLMFLCRGFPIGKQMESAMNAAIQKLEKAAANPQPKPDPEAMKIQADAQANQQRLQAETQLQNTKIQGELQLAHAKMQNELQIEQARIQAKMASDQSEAHQAAIIAQNENDLEAEREREKLAQEERVALAKIESERSLQLELAHIKAAAVVEVARIGAKASDGAGLEAQEQARVNEAEGPVRDDDLHAKLDDLMQRQAPQPPDMSGALSAIMDAHNHTQAMIGDLHGALSSEREIVRDPKTGKPTGIRIKQDPKQLAKQLLT